MSDVQGVGAAGDLVTRKTGFHHVIEQRRAGGAIWWRYGPYGWDYTTDHKVNATWLRINATLVPAEVLREAVRFHDECRAALSESTGGK